MIKKRKNKPENDPRLVVAGDHRDGGRLPTTIVVAGDGESLHRAPRSTLSPAVVDFTAKIATSSSSPLRRCLHHLHHRKRRELPFICVFLRLVSPFSSSVRLLPSPVRLLHRILHSPFSFFISNSPSLSRFSFSFSFSLFLFAKFSLPLPQISQILSISRFWLLRPLGWGIRVMGRIRIGCVWSVCTPCFYYAFITTLQ